MEMIRGNSREFEAGGRVLRLKQYMAADANCAMMEEVIAALSANTRVGALYIQNFEWVRLSSRSLTMETRQVRGQSDSPCILGKCRPTHLQFPRICSSGRTVGSSAVSTGCSLVRALCLACAGHV